MAKKIIESIIISYEDFVDMDFNPPAKYYIRNTNGDYEFLKGNKREVVQAYFDDKYGVGKFSVRSV